MEEAQGYGFDEFSVEMGDFEVKKTTKFDRMWSIGPGGSMAQIPIIEGGLVYVASCNRNVYAISIGNGELVWKYKTEGIILAGSPVYSNGKVYVGSYDYILHCIDAKTGRLVWKYKTEGEINVLPCIDGGKVYFGSKDHNVYCLDAETGRLLWKFRTFDEINACPSVKEGRLYIGSFDRFMYCIDAENGNLVWRFETQGEIHTQNPFLVHDNVVYVASFDNYLYALTAGRGRMLWKFPTGNYGNTASPVLHGNRLYINSRDGFLFCVTLDGKKVWKVTKATMFSMPCIFEDRIYVGGDDKILHCYGLDGKEIWNFETQGIVWMQPSFHGRTVFFTSWDCNLYAVDVDTHRLLWKFRAAGSPSYVSPPNESFELSVKIPNKEFKEEQKKSYDVSFDREDELGTSTYKSEITYQMGTAYIKKGKYQVDEKTEGF